MSLTNTWSRLVEPAEGTTDEPHVPELNTVAPALAAGIQQCPRQAVTGILQARAARMGPG